MSNMKEKKSLIEEFEIKPKKEVCNVKDFEIFTDRNLLDELRSKIIQNLIDHNNDYDSLDNYIKNEIDKTLIGYDINSVQKQHIHTLIDNEINGYGPITGVLKDENITEIMVNGPDQIYVEINGKVIKEDSISFINDDHITRIIQRIVQPLGRTIDAANPMVDARLLDGSRLNAIIPPLARSGPTLTIRKFQKNMDNIEDLLRTGSLTNYMAVFLEACIKAKLNIIISGGTGTGKTSLLNILSSFISHNERVITIEDAAELNLKQNHVISLETRMNNYEKEGEVSIRDLLRNSLRMRPDRIIVGEVRGKESFDMLQAMNTGHDGSLTTMHANSPMDTLNRLETMILMTGIEIPVNAIRGYIENAIDIIVHVDRLSDGKRKITSISEITGLRDEKITIKEIFSFNQKNVNDNGDVVGEFVLYQYIPKAYYEMKKRGINNIDYIFDFSKK